MPRKMRRLAVRSALSAKYAADEIRFIEGLAFEQPRTKEMLACLLSLQLDGKTLIVLDGKDENVQRSANNLPGVKTLLANYLNVVDLLSHDNVLISRAAVDVVETWLSLGPLVVDIDDEDEIDGEDEPNDTVELDDMAALDGAADEEL
jgi:large subunit ribosomal protein L4